MRLRLTLPCRLALGTAPHLGYRRIAQIGPVVVMWGRMTSDEIARHDYGKDAEMTLPRGYDDWRLEGPDEGRHEIGHEDGQTCGRYHEPDEDAPRGYRPKPCTGAMVEDCGANICDTCYMMGEPR